jgi:hypothetical protein
MNVKELIGILSLTDPDCTVVLGLDYPYADTHQPLVKVHNDKGGVVVLSAKD